MKRPRRIFDALAVLLGGLLLTCIVALRATAGEGGVAGLMLVVTPALLGVLGCVSLLTRRASEDKNSPVEPVSEGALTPKSYRRAPGRAAPLLAPDLGRRWRPARLLFLVSLPLLIALLGVAAFALLSRYFGFGPG